MTGYTVVLNAGSLVALALRGARLLGVGHRVIHAGARFASPVVVTREVLDELPRLEPLASLHQPYNLAAIEEVTRYLPNAFTERARTPNISKTCA